MSEEGLEETQDELFENEEEVVELGKPATIRQSFTSTFLSLAAFFDNIIF